METLISIEKSNPEHKSRNGSGAALIGGWVRWGNCLKINASVCIHYIFSHNIRCLMSDYLFDVVIILEKTFRPEDTP